VQIEWDSNEKHNFHYVWLRDNCQCSKCCDISSGQRFLERSNLSDNIAPSKMTTTGKLSISWNDSHQSVFEFDFLRQNQYTIREKKSTNWDPLTRIQRSDFESLNTEEGIHKWFQIINEDGVSIVENVPAELGFVEKLANKISFIKETSYGRIFDVVSLPNATHIAYTSHELKLHMDIHYLEVSPGFQFLHCLKAEATGGESTFADIFYIAKLFKKENPEDFDVLSKVKLTFHKNDPERYLQRKPLFHVVDGELVSINYSPMFEGPLRTSENLILPFYKAYKKFQQMVDSNKYTITTLMKPGDCAVFNNRRILHGRLQFDDKSGSRHLQGTYVDHDEFANRFLLLQKRFGGPDLKHLGSSVQLK
jgi:gamma-butyrobetaine dioxygenase